MRVAEVSQHGSPEVLHLVERPAARRVGSGARSSSRP